MVAALGRELAPAGTGLEALVEAVRASPDRASIRRRLRCECAVCGWALPREQVGNGEMAAVAMGTGRKWRGLLWG